MDQSEIKDFLLNFNAAKFALAAEFCAEQFNSTRCKILLFCEEFYPANSIWLLMRIEFHGTGST